MFGLLDCKKITFMTGYKLIKNGFRTIPEYKVVEKLNRLMNILQKMSRVTKLSQNYQ